MVKVMEDDPRFKKGAYPGQKSDGLYMDGDLVDLANLYSTKIVNDMQFLGLCCSSTSGVRVGKSTLMQQLGYFYTYLINKKHGLNLTFTSRNVVFKAKDMIKRAHQLPKYSCIILDEGDDLTDHAGSKGMKEIKRFLRKCGQLNLFIIMILPDFFEMPKSIAMGRSNFLIDVQFEDEYDRGYYEYYNETDKKKLYIRGKKFNDYDAWQSTFNDGRFVPMYTLDREEYEKMKAEDLEEDLDEEEEIPAKAVREVTTNIIGKIYPYLRDKYKITQEEVGKMLGLHRNTVERYYREWTKKNFDGGAVTKVQDTSVDTQDACTTTPATNDTIIPIREEGGVGDIVEGAAEPKRFQNETDDEPDEEDRFQNETKKEPKVENLKGGLTRYSYD